MNSGCIEIVPERLYYTALTTKPERQKGVVFFSVDKELVYWNFYNDFGPLNLGQTKRFCDIVLELLNDSRFNNKKIVYYSGVSGQARANAATLISCFGMVYLNQTPEQAFRPFENMTFPYWQDASPYENTFPLGVLDVLKGFQKALKLDFVNFKNFDVQEYEHFERVENGDLTWISRGEHTEKFIAFAGPKHCRADSGDGYLTLTPEDYLPYFTQNNVQLVIRLNRKCYDANRFEAAGIRHLDLIYPDGSNPPSHIIEKFFQACKRVPRGAAIAVHCKAGLGRTGTLIGAYFMRHYNFTAKEVIGYMRLARSGMVIGPQQNFMESLQQTPAHMCKKNLKFAVINFSCADDVGMDLERKEEEEGEYTQGDFLRQARFIGSGERINN